MNNMFKSLKVLNRIPLFKQINHKSRKFSNNFDLEYILKSKEKLLLTPGPLSTSSSVKNSATRDFGSRDDMFIDLIASVREDILDVGNLNKNKYTSVLMQGSGTFAVESTIQTAVPKNGSILVITNGSYGDRAGKICELCNINNVILKYPENEKPNLDEIYKIISSSNFTNVFMVHSETTSGIINPITELGNIISSINNNIIYIVDGMSSYGGIPIDFDNSNIDFLVTSANKCLQGIPGFGVVIAKKDILNNCKNNSRSLSLDLYDQFIGLESNGQFRFTPPTHSICAFKKALNELKEEGGIKQRGLRYYNNKQIVLKTLNFLGFELYLSEEYNEEGYIITSVKYPNSSNWDFKTFYRLLAEKDFLIYPGKVTNADCFRIGHIGNIYPKDMEIFSKHLIQICNNMELIVK